MSERECRVHGELSRKNTMASNELSRMVNRHKARLLSNLEDAGCPQIFRNAVVAELDWLRSDLTKIESIGDTHDTDESEGRFNR